VKTGEFYLVGNGRAGTKGHDKGLIFIVSDEKTDAVLGVHILGPRATELVSLGVLAMENELTIEDLKKTVLPHLTFSESFFEAALASSGEAIHMLQDNLKHEPEEENG
jgi:dihydrolipoamide dehydrogenase